MGISNNSPTMSYIHASGISVVWNNETYMVQDFATNKKYIYWNADLPNQLNASNVMPNRSTKQYLVIVNDNGMATLVIVIKLLKIEYLDYTKKMNTLEKSL